MRARKNRERGQERPPEIPGYRVIEPAFAHGAYGVVWLARNKGKTWRAVKVVTLEKFGNDRAPYDREYDGVSRYREISDKHPGLIARRVCQRKIPELLLLRNGIGGCDRMRLGKIARYLQAVRFE